MSTRWSWILAPLAVLNIVFCLFVLPLAKDQNFFPFFSWNLFQDFPHTQWTYDVFIKQGDSEKSFEAAGAKRNDVEQLWYILNGVSDRLRGGCDSSQLLQFQTETIKYLLSQNFNNKEITAKLVRIDGEPIEYLYKHQFKAKEDCFVIEFDQ